MWDWTETKWAEDCDVASSSRPITQSPLLTPALSLAALGVNWENMIRLGTGNTLRRKWILQRIHFSLGWVWTSNLSVALLILTSQSLCPFWTLIYSIIPLYMTAVSLIGMWEDLFCYVRYFISNFSVLSSWRNCYEDVQLENLSRLWLSDASDQDRTQSCVAAT